MTDRILTISHIFQPRRTGPDKPTPFLRMAGQWMKEAGFPIGRRVTVRVEPGKLVLTPVESDEKEG